MKADMLKHKEKKRKMSILKEEKNGDIKMKTKK